MNSATMMQYGKGTYQMNKLQVLQYRMKIRKEFQNLPDELWRATEEEMKKEHERRYNKTRKEWSK